MLKDCGRCRLCTLVTSVQCVPGTPLPEPCHLCAQPLLSKHEATIDRHLAEMRTTATDFASLHFNKCGAECPTTVTH